MPINRRHLLGSLAAASVCPSAVSAAEPLPSPAVLHDAPRHAGWFLVRETKAQDRGDAVDFWNDPFSDVDYFRHLPPEIARGVMWYDETSDPADHLASGAAERFFRRRADFNWTEAQRRYAFHPGGAESLPSTLRSLIGGEGPRTAFVSLDSFGPLREPGWADVLPAFRSCYDRIIGHFHLTERGLRQERDLLERRFDATYFHEYFTRAAEQCDAVIVTSAALAEADLRCNKWDSTGQLVGNLICQLGHALLTPAVLARIAGKPGSPRKPRLFALGSLEVWTVHDYLDVGYLMGRQRSLVNCSFGTAIPCEADSEQPGFRPVDVENESALLVVTRVGDPHSPLMDEFRHLVQNKFLATANHIQQFSKGTRSNLNGLRIIVLWLFAVA